MTGTNQTCLGGDQFVLPKILIENYSYKSIEWKISFYEEFSEVIFPEGNFNQDLVSYLEEVISGNFSSFREQVVFNGVPFLVGYFSEKKEIRLYTARLGRELFLVEKSVQLRESSEYKEYFSSISFDDFRNYVEAVAEIASISFPSEYDRVTHRYKLPELIKNDKFEKLIPNQEKLIQKLLLHLNSYSPSLFEKFSDFGLGLTAQFALIRIHLLKFLAILPSLDHDTSGHEVKRILLESLRRLLKDSKIARNLKKRGQDKPLPKKYVILFKAVYFLSYVMPAGILAFSVRTKVRFLAKRFIAGETIELAQDSFKALFSTGRDVTLDQLGELVVSEKEADHYLEEVLKLIRGFSLHVNKGERNAAGIHRAHVSIKISALCSDFKPEAFDYTYKYVSPRLKKILLEAKEHDVFINIDAEHYDYRDIVFDIYKKVLLETKELESFDGTGIVLQAYLKDAAKHLEEIVELASKRKIAMPVRLVKGAYWDAETVEADAHSFNAPEFLNKEETDLNFRQLIIEIFESSPNIKLCLASHNYSDHCFAEVLRTELYSNIPIIEHQCLHMTYEALSTAMAKMGWVVRNYVPIGSLIVGMAYLVRRIMENSSQVGVLTIMRSHKKKIKILSPEEIHSKKKENGDLFRELTISSLTSDFFNVAPLRLYLPEHRDAINSALKYYKEINLGKCYPNSFLLSGKEQNIISSSDEAITVGKIQFGNVEDAKRAVDSVYQSFLNSSWCDSPWIYRASVFLKAADILLAKRNELSSLIVYEAGKSIPEALGDVDEAIDFLTFYAREEGRQQGLNPRIKPRGPVAVISPWNFPLAIPCGMVSAPLIAGNTVILKSAEQTPLIAQSLVDIFHLAGVPKDVLIHLPGEGETVGNHLVESEKISSIVFTGSKFVGQLIAHKAGKRIFHNPKSKTSYPVKTITEMGGKNCVIVTENAELDETVSGVLYSSFGHAGQKCSAASRVLVHNNVKLRLIERLKEACTDIEVSEAFNFSCSINPVISLEDKERLIRQVKEASVEAKKVGGQVVVDRSAEDSLPGFCVGPAIFELPTSEGKNQNSYCHKELFGPVLHVIGFDDLDQAVDIFNSSEYALTGGIFSQSQDDIDYVTSKLECGNIYVNRTITGARVGIEPFGGFKLSGTGPKAGGRGYLQSFHLNPSRVEIKDEIIEEGSEYSIELCPPSKLLPINRIKRVNNFLNSITHHFDSLYGGVYGEEKSCFKKFSKWVRKNALSFQISEHQNRKIPGQLSFCDFNLIEEHVVVIATLKRPSFATFMQVLGALTMGTGVTVISRNEASYGWWGRILTFYKQSGLSKAHFDVYLGSEKQTAIALKNPMIGTVIFDGKEETIKNYLEVIFDGKYNEKRMRKILTPFDSPDIYDFKRICASYVWVRAFAINTMRHGAPMEVEL